VGQLPARVATRIYSSLIGVGGVFVLLALFSYDPADLGLLSSQPNLPTHNIGGVLGAWVAFIGRGGFGWASLVLPCLAGLWATRVWRGESSGGLGWTTRATACLAFLASFATVLSLCSLDPTFQTQLGGMIGYLLVGSGRYYLGATGTALLGGCVGLLSWMLLVDQVSFPKRISQVWASLMRACGWRHPAAVSSRGAGESVLAGVSAMPRAAVAPTLQGVPLAARGRATVDAQTPLLDEVRARIRSTVTPKPKSIPTTPAQSRQASGGFQLPGLDLLNNPPPVSERQLGEDLQRNTRILEETLRDFGIEARCVNIDRGPAVTRYELQPAPGVKLTRIVALADDIALVMKAASCHIVAPIPGKGLVGVEVPNSTATVVYLKEILASNQYHQLRSPLTLAIGKDVSGHAVVHDLRECPHLLVAGATGSGKTVCLNALLTGFLHQASPDDVKFLMIDPKMVELVLFNDIPHLVTPVVTDVKRAAVALNWAVHEMERRYQSLSKAGARNIDAYNQKAQAGAPGTEEGKMPYLVIVVDELADLMMIAAQDVEGAITRLSQLSRAVGLHMILATQRPSVDVITGVIKANFPARIAFQVPSKVDSRTILDANGADKLLGRGDLMFLRPGAAKPIRAQGCFVTDAELERVVAHLKAQRAPAYDEQLMTRQDKPADAFISDEKDELYEMAKKLVIESRQASTSLLQRRLRLGYSRAARILDLMEQEGIVGPPQGSRPREVLVDPRAMTGAQS